MEIFIRQISEKDVFPVAALCGQLGYDLSIDQTRENIKAVLSTNNHDGFVVVFGEEIIGWIGVGVAIQIESPACCEIRGLVVDDRYRNRGVGKMLVEKAKQWCHEKGYKSLRLRCNMKRTQTHLFYQHLNFRVVKEQKVFEIETG